jgi:hypothetical protein
VQPVLAQTAWSKGALDDNLPPEKN